MKTLTSLAAVVALALTGSLSSTPAQATPAPDATSSRIVVPLLPAGPKVVRPGQTVQFLAPFHSSARGPANANVKFGAGCGSRDPDTGYVYEYNPWQTILVPFSSTPLYPENPSVDLFVTAKVRIPKQCYHADSYGGDGTYEVRIADYMGSGEDASVAAPFEIGKRFNRKNIRYNLGLQDGVKSSKRYQAHHTMPVKFEDWFKARHITIHDPQYLVWWCSKKGVSTNHQSNAYAYNARWQEWIKAHRKATKAETLAFRAELLDDYVYECP